MCGREICCCCIPIANGIFFLTIAEICGALLMCVVFINSPWFVYCIIHIVVSLVLIAAHLKTSRTMRSLAFWTWSICFLVLIPIHNAIVVTATNIIEEWNCNDVNRRGRSVERCI